MSFELVSTIIPVYNRAALLQQAVDSVLTQTYRPIEIIIVDDGSTDDTRTTIEGLKRAYPDIIRGHHQSNQGPGPAREAGRILASGEFIQYLDSDDRLCPGKFEAQVALLQKCPEIDIVYGTTRLVDAGGRVLQPSLKWSGEERSSLFPGLLIDRWWSTHTPLWRGSFCDRLGPWSSLRYSEDWEYEARAGSLHARLARVDMVVSEHRAHTQPRETTSGRWLDPAEQVPFFETLFHCALRAGVLLDTPEMRHFARWVFTAARSAGKAGDTVAAQRLFDIARQAHGGWELDLLGYRLLAGAVGWSYATCFVDGMRHMLGRRPGPHTRRQSWMEPEK